MTKTPAYNGYLSVLAVLSAAILLLFRAEDAEEAAVGALKLCASVIIPSLFPYMVISGLIVTLGAAQILGRPLSPLCSRLFRLPGEASGAILLGALCGFPIGGQVACRLYDEGRLTRSQTERLIAIANNTGPAFVIEVIGAHYWGSRGLGVTVYLAQILSALLIGAVYTRLRPNPEPIRVATVKPRPVRKKDVLTKLSESVSNSAIAVLIVCGFIVFFAVFLSLISHLLQRIDAQWLLPFLGAALEFTGGAAFSAEMGDVAGAFLTGFAVGWSGLSVFAQCKVFTAPAGIRLLPAAVCKAIQGVLTGAAAALYTAFFFTPSVTASSCVPLTDTPTYLVMGEVFLLILFCLVPVISKKIGQKRRHSALGS